MLEWLSLVVFGVSGVWLSSIDLREHRLPNPGTGASLALYLTIGLVALDRGALQDAVIASAFSTALLAAWALVPPKSLGWGDVKLQAGLGFLLGWWDPRLVAAQLVSAVVAGGFAAGWMVVVRRVSPGYHLPFGPFLVGGAAVAFLLGKSAEII